MAQRSGHDPPCVAAATPTIGTTNATEKKKASRKRKPARDDAAEPRDSSIVKFWTDAITKPLSDALPPCYLTAGRVLTPEERDTTFNKLFGSVWFTTAVTQLPPPTKDPPPFDGRMSEEILRVMKDKPPPKKIAKNDKFKGETPTGPCAARLRKAKEHPHPIRTRSFRVYPDENQHRVLQIWFAVQRWTYNQCVADHKRRRAAGEKGYGPGVPTMQDLRDLYRKDNAITELVRQGKLHIDFALDILSLGADVRQVALDDFIQARDHEQKKHRVNAAHRWDFKFRSRRDEQSLCFQARAWTTPPINHKGKPALLSSLKKAAAEAARNTRSTSFGALSRRQALKAAKTAKQEARSAATRKDNVDAAKACGLKTYLRRMDVLSMAKKPRLDPSNQQKEPQHGVSVKAAAHNAKKRPAAELAAKASAKWETETVPEVMPMVYWLTYDRRGRYYLQHPVYVPVKPQAQESHEEKVKHSVLSIDPGDRTPFTVYDADGRVIEIGRNDGYRLFKALKRADSIHSKMDTTKNQTKERSEFPEGAEGTEEWRLWNKRARNRGKCHRRELRLAYLGALERVRDRVRDLHTKAATFLCRRGRVILIPTFESSQMVKRWCRKLRTKTVRSLMTWSHYAFRQTLKQRAELYEGCTVIEVDEPYTSQTCGLCGHLHKTSDKIYACRNTNGCGYVADRDFNGARNILLRYLTRVVCA